MRIFYLDKKMRKRPKNKNKNTQTWLAKLKNIYANIHKNTYVYTCTVKRPEVNI